ncbi:hypothetical protein D3C76_1179300 [compost metagenome]
MKALATIIIFTTLFGCADGQLFPERYGPELAYKCDINPYDPDCLKPPPVLKSS